MVTGIKKVTVRRGKLRTYLVECYGCSYRGPCIDPAKEARDHAKENPGHEVTVDKDQSTMYTVRV